MGVGLDTVNSLVKSFTFEVTAAQWAAVARGAGGDGFSKLPGAANAADVLGFSLYVVDSEGQRLACPVAIDDGVVLVRAASTFAAGSLLRVADTDGRVEKIVKIAATQIEHLAGIAANTAVLLKKARAIVSCNVQTASGATGPFRQLQNTAVAANAKVLGLTADALLAVTITAGGVTGRCNILPAGVAPANSKEVALAANRQSVVFLGADAVTAATIDYLTPTSSRLGQFKIGQTGENPNVGEVGLNAGRTAINFNAADGVTEVLIEYLIEDPFQNVVAYALAPATAENDLVPALIVRGQASGLA